MVSWCRVSPKSPDSKLTDLLRTPQPFLNECRHSLFSLYPTPTKAKDGGLSLPCLPRQGVEAGRDHGRLPFPCSTSKVPFIPGQMFFVSQEISTSRGICHQIPCQPRLPSPPLLCFQPTPSLCSP